MTSEKVGIHLDPFLSLTSFVALDLNEWIIRYPYSREWGGENIMWLHLFPAVAHVLLVSLFISFIWTGFSNVFRCWWTITYRVQNGWNFPYKHPLHKQEEYVKDCLRIVHNNPHQNGWLGMFSVLKHDSSLAFLNIKLTTINYLIFDVANNFINHLFLLPWTLPLVHNDYQCWIPSIAWSSCPWWVLLPLIKIYEFLHHCCLISTIQNPVTQQQAAM